MAFFCDFMRCVIFCFVVLQIIIDFGELYMIELLTDNHYDTIIDIFDNTKERIMIISPFLSKCMANKLCDCVRNNHLECYFITRIYLEDLLSKVNSIEAIEMMIKAGIKVYAQKWLHTKLYLFDNNVGIIGSANFTSGGFGGNIELSLMASNESDLINQIENKLSPKK